MKNNQYRKITTRILVKIPPTIRLAVMLSLGFFILTAEHVYAQRNAMVSIQAKNKTIANVLESIEEQTNYKFVYANQVVNTNKTVSVNINKQSVTSALNTLFVDADISYSVVNNKIILNKKEAATALQQVQNATVRGIVRNETGEALAGVNVVEKGTSNGTTTDVNGVYSIHYKSKDAVLIFTYLGFTPKEETIGTRNVLDITLSENINQIEEVVVIGYGTVKRVNLAGAVSTTDAKTFESRPVQNAASALQGEMPGLTVIRTSGAPGSSPVIRVRDVSSINGGSPLVLIDGAEGDLGMINAADIENISVLKDGTAAIYGARAADGVILVTTKSARRNQKLRVALDAYSSVKKPALLKKTANLYQHAAMGVEITDGSFPLEYTQEELQLIADNSDVVLPTSNWGRWSGYPKFYHDQNWNDHVIGNGSLQNYNLGLSGGGDSYSYLVSLGHQRESGLPKFGVDADKRYFVRSKSNIQIVKNLDYDLNLSYEASNREYSSGISEGQNIWELIYKTRSWAPLYNPNGSFYTFEGFDNPAQVLEQGGVSNLTTGNFTINNQLRWKIIDGLNIIGRAVIRKKDNDKSIINKMIYSYNWEDVNHRIGRKPNSAERNYGKTLSKNFTLYGEYKKTLGAHDIGIMVGGANESADYDWFSAKRINFDQQESMSLQLGSSEDQQAWSEGNAWTINSFFSRINYSFANKYILEGTLRGDGSSRFHPDHRWGYFPGVSGAWRLGEESFMKNLNLFNDFKFRASYGEMGNQSGIGLYDYIQLVALSRDYYPFGDGQKGQMASAGNIISTSRTWETISTTNVAFDFALVQNKLFGSFDYFWKTNKNMLIPVTYPLMLGANAPNTNNGRLEIKGWEIALGWRDRIGELSYSVRGSLSDAQNKVAKRVGSNLIGLGLNATPQGYPLSSYFGYQFDGIIQNDQELIDYKARFSAGGIPGDLTVGDAKYRDLDNDGLLSVLGNGANGSGDVVYLGNTNPRYSFGLNLNVEFNSFDFGAFIQGVGNRTMFLEGEANKPFAQPWFQSAEYWYGKTWTPERTDAKYPAITGKGKRGYNYNVSSNTKHNVAYARLKNLQFGYTLPKSLLTKLSLEKVRVYFSGEDLFEVHNAPGGWDPEDGGSYVSYPFARNYSIGANIVF